MSSQLRDELLSIFALAFAGRASAPAPWPSLPPHQPPASADSLA
ncbi:hypothetical protein HMPREF9946_05031 [Acetobacteraceae bacterium AT-5844]|nr:hypothetical protein HMPREF9946_05031 [Acetobacteraceae bacterium AT-5844]